MKLELQSIIEGFDKADEILESIYLPLWNKYGVDDEFVRPEMDQMIVRAKKRDE